MQNITFNDLNLYDEFGLVLINKTIEAPVPKLTTVDVPGMDGVIDFTEYFGEIKYQNRKLTFEFETKLKSKDQLELYSTIQREIHGKKMKIILDDDQDYYYVGRVMINQWKSNRRIGQITIDVDAEPYKYKIYKTVVEKTITGTDNIILVNSRQSVIPTIKTTGGVTLKFGTITKTLSAGTYGPVQLVDFVLRDGSNLITATAETEVTVIFEYQEGAL